MDVLSFFPLPDPRQGQIKVLEKIVDLIYKQGKRNIILEAPVGSGKSAVAVTLAKEFGSAHILTPLKSLQDQYFADFYKEDLVLMKGRNAYPCTYPYKNEREAARYPEGRDCSEGPCRAKTRSIKTSRWGKCGPSDMDCPYKQELEVAKNSSVVIHSLSSFFYQCYYSDAFQPKPLLIVDECHKLEDNLREFSTERISIPVCIPEENIPPLETTTNINTWVDWLEQYEFHFSDKLERVYDLDTEEESFTSERLLFLKSIFGMRSSSKFKGVFAVTYSTNGNTTDIDFIPDNIVDISEELLLSMGEVRVFMSGTIYDIPKFCETLGLDPSETEKVGISSDFPASLRPIYMKNEFLVDTSHAKWDENFPTIIDNIRKIMEVYGDAKGLIHAPSYFLGQQIAKALVDTGRIRYHDKETFKDSLDDFYDSKDPEVFLSPTCQQGIDFKDDRARFQIIVRIPYAPTKSPFVKVKSKSDSRWANLQALIVFGQQLGRINRNESDYGATILLDSRFPSFISRNNSLLPGWVTRAIIRN